MIEPPWILVTLWLKKPCLLEPYFKAQDHSANISHGVRLCWPQSIFHHVSSQIATFMTLAIANAGGPRSTWRFPQKKPQRLHGQKQVVQHQTLPTQNISEISHQNTTKSAPCNLSHPGLIQFLLGGLQTQLLLLSLFQQLNFAELQLPVKRRFLAEIEKSTSSRISSHPAFQLEKYHIIRDDTVSRCIKWFAFLLETVWITTETVWARKIKLCHLSNFWMQPKNGDRFYSLLDKCRMFSSSFLHFLRRLESCFSCHCRPQLFLSFSSSHCGSCLYFNLTMACEGTRGPKFFLWKAWEVHFKSTKNGFNWRCSNDTYAVQIRAFGDV